MALFKISKGLKSKLPKTYNEGYCYFTTDDGKMYIDTSNASSGRVCLNAAKADQLATARTITLSGDASGSVSFDGSKNVTLTVDISALDDINDAKQATITGAATTITSSNLTASRALVSNSSGKVAVSAVTSTELGYLDGVTSNIQTQLDGKAASSHGTHVTFSTTAPVMDGTDSVGTASTVARSDHRHPTDTSRAAASDLTSHTGNTTVHITSAERTNWNAAKSHADSAHAPSNAEKNQNAFSNVTVGSTTISADTTTDTLTLVAGNNVTITPDATNDKITITATNTTYSAATQSAAGLMSAADKKKLDGIASSANKTTVDSSLSSTSANPVQNKVINTALAGKSDTGHTHNYAGSSSAGGAAASANKLNTDAGSATQPVYFSNGIPVKTTYTLGASVPSNAKFTDTVYTLPAAGSSLGGVKSGGDVTISNGVITVKDDSHNHTIANIDNLQTTLDAKAAKNTGIFYIEGTGDTAGTWLGSHSDITEYYAGLILAYKIGVAGLSSGTTLNINNLGAVTVVKNATSAISTNFEVNSVIFLVYTIDSSGTAYWKAHDYDSNTKTTTGTSNKASTKLFLTGATSQTSSGTTTYSNSKVYIGTDNCLYSNGQKVSTTDTNTTYTFATGSSNGTISVTPSGGKATNVAVKGLGSAAYTASTAYDAAGTAQTKANAALASAKTYADGIKNDLLNGAGAAYDTLKELGDLIDDNTDAIDALEIVATNKADKSHKHAASDITSGTLASARIPAATTSAIGGVKIGSNIKVSSGTISVPSADGSTAGVTIVYPAASCTTFSSDSGTVTPLAVQKGAKMFSITRPSSSTNKAITRYSNTTGDVQDSKIIIEDVTNTRDSSKKAQVIAVPAEGNKKMVYGYCTDQVDGTSFIGGIFDADATEYPYNQGLAIGGTSGNLLWKGVKVATTSDIPSVGNGTVTIKQNGTKKGSFTLNQSGNATIELTDTDTNTTYSAATQSAAGLMSAADKKKLDGIATGANKYTYTLPSATSSVLGGVKIGSNITVSSGTISLTKSNVTSALGYTPPTTNTTYGVVSTTADGLAPKRDGSTTKFLRGDGTWATPPDTNTVYTHPTTTAVTGVPTGNQTPGFGGKFSVNQVSRDKLGHVSAITSRTITIPSTLANGTSTAGLIKTSSTVTSSSGYTACPVINGVPYYKDTNTHAVSSVNGKTGAVTLSGYDVNAIPTFGQHNYDVNNCYNAGIFMIANGSGCPSGSPYGSLLTLPYRQASGNTSTDFGTQIFIPNGDDSKKPNSLFYRSSNKNAWNSWQEVSVVGHTHSLSSFGITATATELNYVDGVTSNIQTQLNDKLPITGGIITGTTGLIIDGTNVTDQVGYNYSLAVITNASKLGGIAVANGVDRALCMFMDPGGSMGLADGATGDGICYKYGNSYHLGPSGVYSNGSVLYGAAWNDYAEYRSQKEEIKPGYCVASADNGQVYKTTEKFQACDGIVSDTFGFAIGETEECKTPLAVAGRVLAYCEGNRYDYNAGDTVCAGPDGKVVKMTREEIREWPDRIIGIVSEIPEYETWGSGNVPVNGRIWIKVK